MLAAAVPPDARHAGLVEHPDPELPIPHDAALAADRLAHAPPLGSRST